MDNEKVLCYKYVFQVRKEESEKPVVCVRFVTDVVKGHDKLISAIKDDENILACYREYVHEIDLLKMLQNENIKEKEKKE